MGLNPLFRQAAQELGELLARAGCGVVYGGGNVGLMGVVADACLSGGAPVVGVLPQSLMQREVGHTGLSELQVVPDMHERKRRMADLADLFIALPGGLGTLEELFEVWTWRHLGYHQRPIGLLNTAGYYQPLLDFLESSRAAGFIDAGQLAMLHVADSPAALLERMLPAVSGLPRSAADYGRT